MRGSSRPAVRGARLRALECSRLFPKVAARVYNSRAATHPTPEAIETATRTNRTKLKPNTQNLSQPTYIAAPTTALDDSNKTPTQANYTRILTPTQD